MRRSEILAAERAREAPLFAALRREAEKPDEPTRWHGLRREVAWFAKMVWRAVGGER